VLCWLQYFISVLIDIFSQIWWILRNIPICEANHLSWASNNQYHPAAWACRLPLPVIMRFFRRLTWCLLLALISYYSGFFYKQTLLPEVRVSSPLFLIKTISFLLPNVPRYFVVFSRDNQTVLCSFQIPYI